ncbi:hypothetical protein ACSBOB_19795 [Mesorhizobium sp. ASY16-5R]|uniref:hypothetical protein n=1 Tax=Mesorhizobium sp. ASY16-5R TaxID=3445772 RepID=UPI003F9EBA9A
MPKKLSSRLVKKNRYYSREQAAKAVGGRKQTIDVWVWRQGLKTVNGFIPGRDLIDFMQARSAARRKPCKPGHVFCLGCKDSRAPAFDEVELVRHETNGSAIIRALCPECSSVMCRNVSREQLADFARRYRVTK